MDRDIVIKAEGVSKKYCKSLKRSMLYGVLDIGRNALGMRSHAHALRPSEFWAVQDISFELKRGETLGLIGPNGSGKTTLLKMLNGIFWPDRGRISIRGRVGALIAVGAGFHPLMTGRENIYVNGAILGMSKQEITKKFDSIVEFADIGDFLDTPVKYYSSGMFVRLGFSVAIHSHPDILLVDEVLAVGDTTFQSKCYSQIAKLIGSGVAIILVAHNMDTIRHMCKSALYLSNGMMQAFGPSGDVVLAYLRQIHEKEIEKAKELKDSADNGRTSSRRRGRITSVRFFDETGYETAYFQTGGAMRVRIGYSAKEDITNPVFAVHFYANRILYTSFISNRETLPMRKVKGEGVVELALDHAHLPAGVYAVSVVFSQGVEFNHLDWQDQEYFVQINKSTHNIGLLALPSRWGAVDRNESMFN